MLMGLRRPMVQCMIDNHAALRTLGNVKLEAACTCCLHALDSVETVMRLTAMFEGS